METFSFPRHSPTHLYPKGDSFKFGRGYRFTAAPQLPVQRTIVLHFEAMQWFLNNDGSVDTTSEPEINIALLDAFYQRHYTAKSFIYVHPIFGAMTVKFADDAPFECPKSIKGGGGVTEGFELTLIEQGT